MQSFQTLQMTHKSSDSLSALVFDIVEIQIENERSQTAFNFFDAVANGLSSHFSNVVEV